jgi:hypothetical protein
MPARCSITSRQDARPACNVMYPLREVSFLAVCVSIASGDDYDHVETPFFSALALHCFVGEPFELGHKWMPRLTLRHYQACGILFRRNPPLGACTSAPKELASRVLIVECRRFLDQRRTPRQGVRARGSAGTQWRPVPPPQPSPASGRKRERSSRLVTQS